MTTCRQSKPCGPTAVCCTTHAKSATAYAVGDRIRWLEKGQTLNGVVVEVLDEDIYHVKRHVPDQGHLHYAVTAEDIVPF